METPDLVEIAKQLRQPEGEMGKTVALRMNSNNAPMYDAALHALSMEAYYRILEIGMGNGAFVPDILSLAPDIRYTGCDFSPTMVEEAELINASYIQKGQARFMLCEAAELPFPGPYFHRALAINTLYFWENPQQELEEIKRVLHHHGKLILAIRPESVMRHLPFTRHGFRLYGKDELMQLLEESGYENVEITEHAEPALEVSGEKLNLSTLIAVARKP